MKLYTVLIVLVVMVMACKVDPTIHFTITDMPGEIVQPTSEWRTE